MRKIADMYVKCIRKIAAMYVRSTDLPSIHYARFNRVGSFFYNIYVHEHACTKDT